MGKINHAAAVVAAVAHWVLGAAWFTLLAVPWLAGTRIPESEMAAMKAHPSAMPYVVALVCNLLVAYTLAWVLGKDDAPSAGSGAKTGLALGVGIAAAVIVTEMVFEARTAEFMAIAAGYPVVGSAIMGTILGAWRKKG